MSFNATLVGILVTDIDVFNAALQELAEEAQTNFEPVKADAAIMFKLATFAGVPIYLDRQAGEEEAYSVRYDTDHSKYLASKFGVNLGHSVRDDTYAYQDYRNYQKKLNDEAQAVMGPLIQRYALIAVERQSGSLGYMTRRVKCDNGDMQLIAETMN